MGIFDAIRKGIPGRDAGATQARPTQQQQAPRPTLVQGGPAYFTPEGYRPPMQPQQAFMPTDTMGDPIGDMFRRQLPPVRIPLPRVPPQKDPRDDFLSIGGVGGKDGIDDPRMEPMPEPIDMPQPVFLGDPNQPITGGPAPTPPGMGGGFGSIYDNLQEFMENNPDRVNRGGGMLGKTDPQPPMPPMAPPMMPPVDIDRPIIRGLEDREIMNDFMSIERMDEPRDEFIPRMTNENPVPFIPQVEMPRDMPPIMPPSFERIEEDPRVPLEEPIAMPRNPELVAEIQRRMDLPPMMPELMDPSMDEPMPMMPQLMTEPMPMPMQPRMQMPGPIATPTPRLQRPSLPMMPMMGGRGRR